MTTLTFSSTQATRPSTLVASSAPATAMSLSAVIIDVVAAGAAGLDVVGTDACASAPVASLVWRGSLSVAGYGYAMAAVAGTPALVRNGEHVGSAVAAAAKPAAMQAKRRTFHIDGALSAWSPPV